MVFLSLFMRMPGRYIKISPRLLPAKSSPIHRHYLITLSSTLYEYSLVTEKRRKINDLSMRATCSAQLVLLDLMCLVVHNKEIYYGNATKLPVKNDGKI
jgi:hypothetical protein